MSSAVVLAVLGFLTGLVPLILQIGTFLVGKFISNQDDKAQALASFYSAIQAHANDALASVALNKSNQDQLDELNKLPTTGPS